MGIFSKAKDTAVVAAAIYSGATGPNETTVGHVARYCVPTSVERGREPVNSGAKTESAASASPPAKSTGLASLLFK